MEDELTHSHSPAAADAPTAAEAGASAPPLPADDSYKKVRELALRQLDKLIAYEAKVLKGDDAEAIHDMRVATRRLQQVLDLLYGTPRPPELRRMRRQIRRCRQVLGEVRNCDVLLEFVARSLGRKRSARREAWTAVQHYLTARRSESFQRATRKMGKINLAIFYVNLREFLHHDKPHDHAGGHEHHGSDAAHAAVAKDLSRSLESAWSRFEGQVAESHRHSRPDVVHAARIATKRLRYLLEVFHEFGVAGSAYALAWLRQLQKHLGDWHDLEVLEQVMIEMLARPEFLRDHLPLAMEVERLILRQRETKTGFEENYFQMSRSSPEMQRLKEWVAYVLASPSADLAKA